MSSALRLIAATLLVLPVAAVMLTAGMIAYALTVVIWPFYWLRNTGSLLVEALIREMYRPL
jgi:hypothetical protein